MMTAKSSCRFLCYVALVCLLSGVGGAVVAQPIARLVIHEKGFVIVCYQGREQISDVWKHPSVTDEEAAEAARSAGAISTPVIIVPVATADPETHRVVLSQMMGSAFLPACALDRTVQPKPMADPPEFRVTFLSPTNERYTKRIQIQVGHSRARLTELLQVDLNADGREEVVFAGFYEAPPSEALADEYASLIKSIDAEWGPLSSTRRTFVGVCLKTVSNKERISVLAKIEHHFRVVSDAGVSFEGFTDVDGDGSLELVIGVRGNHWAETAFYSLVEDSMTTMAVTRYGW